MYSENMRRLLASKSFEAGAECIRRAEAASWWEWDGGSRLFFWRWPRWMQKEVRDGKEPWRVGEWPRYLKPQTPVLDAIRREALIKKLTKVQKRGYIEAGDVRSLTKFFDVPKGDRDIRMVYDGTISGLNDVLWSPRFGLPTVEDHLGAVEEGTYMGDMDICDMFLNFIIHESLREYVGVDVSHFRSDDKEFEEGRRRRWERWCRCMMGLSPSPYLAVQQMLWGEELMFGDRKNPNNPFRWDRVVLNLPGMDSYDPSKTWVAKIRADGTMASDMFLYIDDVRTTGRNSDECWNASRRAAAQANYLGIQDAPRKRRPPSKTPGAWAGSIIHTDDDVRVLVSEERWAKTKEIVDWLQEITGSAHALKAIPRKELEKGCGFLLYVARTYPLMTPYLKGIHHTLNSWRCNRKDNGWKMTAKELAAAIAEGRIDPPAPEADAPDVVAAAPRLVSDVKALAAITSPTSPPRRLVRGSKTCVALYGLGDSSGDGFGSALAVRHGLLYRFGAWSGEEKERSSNHRELRNLVEAVEEAARKGHLKDSELFLLTDNSTAEAAYFKGDSSDEELFELVLRLRKIALHYGFILHVIHVAGSRMKESGVDGLSRGDLLEGVMAGNPIGKYIPLHLGADERSGGNVSSWIYSWWGHAQPLTHLNPSMWFDEAHGDKPSLWTPPPAAADAAIRQLRIARHKRPGVGHVIAVPRLFTYLWQKQLMQEADVFLNLPAGTEIWGSNQHEPLCIAICLPLISLPRRTWRGPWVFKGTRCVDELVSNFNAECWAMSEHVSGQIDGVGRAVRYVRKGAPERCGALLRKFLQSTRALPSLPESVVRGMLSPASTGSVPN